MRRDCFSPVSSWAPRMSEAGRDEAPLKLFLVAGEHSGDALGGRLIEALRARATRKLAFAGVGGEDMATAGCPSLFPLSDLAVMSPLDILKRLPFLLKRVKETVAAGDAFAPDALVILDSPEFTHLVARRMRKRRPGLPVVNYVSPTVWAWRPWRARKMRRYVDHVLALLPFEPAAHARLGGPACTYVGHPLSERIDWIGARDGEALARRLGIPPGTPVLVVLPGSRASEVTRLMQPFGDTIAALKERVGPFEIVIPAVSSVRPLIEERLGAWPQRPHIVSGEEDKFASFRLARAALAASGTVTLELAIAQTPMVVAYRIDPSAAVLRHLMSAQSVVLPNLVLGRNVIPEFIQERCTAERLTDALAPLMDLGSPERRAQKLGLADVLTQVATGDEAPSEAAARIVLEHAR
jgi:lipid-A-disaccharide synthase